MGLAASQARFLAITSRKMNCEFQSMQIAQEKLSVTRDLQKASQEYQNSLSATKLVWDTEDNTVYDLSYDVMMTPSMANDYNPYLVTDTKGKIVLSTSMFQAAVDAGVIDAKTGDPKGSRSIGSSDMSKTENQTNGSRNAFLYQLGVKNQVTPESITSIINLGDKGYNNSGIGGEALDKTVANAFNTNSFISYMKKAEDDDGNSIYALKVNDILNSGGYTYIGSKSLEDSKGNVVNNGVVITKSGSPISESEMQKLTLGELLSGQYELTGRMDANGMRTLAESILKSMGKTLGWQAASNSIGGLNVDDESDEALDQAMEFTLKCLNKDYDTSSGGKILSNSVTNAVNQAASTNSIVAGSNNVSSVSLTNMLKSFLTNFAVAIEGFDCGYYVTENDKKKSTYVTDDIGYQFLIKNDNTSIDEKDVLMADFYNQLYNNLCVNGASTDTNKQQQVTDKSYLSNALKNGQLFISSLNNDGYFYQGAYTLNGHVAEVADEDAIAQAEAEYNVTKNKLNYKEQTLELDMKNIDTELSSLTTEYDTVKNLISKNVEKVFTMFST